MSKKKNSIIAVYAIVFILFNVVYLGIPFQKTTASWIVYTFTLISIIVSLFITWHAFKDAQELKSKVYGFPVFRVGFLYVGIQLIICIIISILGLKLNIAAWVPMIISIVLLGLVAIGVIATDNARDVIQDIDNQVMTKTRTVTYFRLDTASIAGSCHDAELRKKLEKFAEEVRYSDPVSNEQLFDIEELLRQEVQVLGDLVRNNELDKAQIQLVKVSDMLADRNRRCKALK